MDPFKDVHDACLHFLTMRVINKILTHFVYFDSKYCRYSTISKSDLFCIKPSENSLKDTPLQTNDKMEEETSVNDIIETLVEDAISELEIVSFLLNFNVVEQGERAD